MNYLAHIFLSGKNSQIQIGNFIGDFVKGSKFEIYPDNIKKGILLHRKIDSFTDSHQVVRDTISQLRPTFGRYSGIIADMYFDYFLACTFSVYSRKSLKVFAFWFYFSTLLHYKYLPSRVKGFIFHFITTNRLNKYATLSGLKASLEIMSTYKISAIQPDLTVAYLTQNHEELEKKFHLFFPDLIEFVKTEII
ncbi:MAG: ACP phosphodiesterase [Paludibacter sp.]|nr:ACP phosphodiesterase [Paludibacter sp.]